MGGYVICVVEGVTDPGALKTYREEFPATAAAYGGKRLIGSQSRHSHVEGAAPVAVLIFEFPTYEAALAWYDSPEYAPLKAMRLPAADVRITIAESV